MGIIDLQLIEKIEVIECEIDDIVELLNPLARAEPRMSWSVDGEMLG
jgi:hypothetical protein